MTAPRPSSFRPLKRVSNPTAEKPEGATSIYLEREDGTGFWVTHAVTDANDGITDADFEFTLSSQPDDEESED